MITLSTRAESFNTEINVFRGDSGRNIVHLPLAGRAFSVNDEIRDIIERIKAGDSVGDTNADLELLAELEATGLIGEPNFKVPRTEQIQAFRPTEATLIFTETCNLGCTYCYASSTAGKSNPMSEKIARAAVDFVTANAAQTERRNASFRYIGGGEPTAEWQLLEDTTSYIQEVTKQQEVSHFIRLITNGTLLTSDRIKWISQNIQFVTLSFDILPELQKHRPYANGSSTHAKLLDVVRRLADAGVEFHLRTTISVAGAAKLEEMVQYVYENCRAKSIRFEPLSVIGRSLVTAVEKPTEVVFVDSFKAAYRLGKKLGINVTCKMFTNLVRRNSRFCDAEFSVTPDGTVTGCHRYSRKDHSGFDLFRLGEFDGERFIFEMDRVNALRRIDVHHFKECNNCVARWNCAGGCLSARVSGDGISEKGPLCDLTRELLKFSIDEKVGEKGHGI